jgi:hypothetical protein
MKRMFVEMLLVMAVGMVVLDPVWAWTFDALGRSGSSTAQT